MANYPFNIISKPAGPLCNLDCAYCYYLEKEKLFPESQKRFSMSMDTLETFTRKYIHEQAGNEITFVWQGGEPCLAGIDFYKQALQFQRKYAQGKQVYNSFQTNGLLLDDEWCRLFYENNFLIGISIDGPRELHDKYRLDKGGKGTFDKVLYAINLLKKHRVAFNTLTVINNINVEHGKRIYRFLKEIGSHYMQFIPIVERIADNYLPTDLSMVLPENEDASSLANWSVPALKYGRFMVEVFNEWIKKDVGKYFVQLFDSTLANEMGLSSAVCIYNKYCGNALAIEHTGDLFACDHYVYPEYKLGNINKASITSMLSSTIQKDFSRKKSEQLPEQCLQCNVLRYCNGECPKNRFNQSNTGQAGLNYLCAGYKHFFGYVQPYMKFMANELRNERPAANVMYQKPQNILKRFG